MSSPAILDIHEIDAIPKTPYFISRLLGLGGAMTIVAIRCQT